MAVGNSQDNTRDLVAAVDHKIRILDSVWNDDLKKGGRFLADGN